MALTADDGTVLKPKEGIVLDQQGHPLTSAPWGTTHGSHTRGRSFFFSLPIPAVVGAIVFVPLALAMGAALITVIGILLAVFFVLSTVARLFG